MKNILIILTLILIAILSSCKGASSSGGSFSYKKVDLDNDKTKYSYAMGHYIAKNMLESQGVPMDMDAFKMAMFFVSVGIHRKRAGCVAGRFSAGGRMARSN